ncbi:hypothetical protein [Tenacibaculum sp. A30]|uniref:hypothetical protein n=1 Tax=Tenacibaculum sp. A30 TaxID=3442644 RepID=UPI003EBD91EC
MKNIFRLLIVLFLIYYTQDSKAQNIERLRINNGFRTIKLGTDVHLYPEFIKKNSSNSKYFGFLLEDYHYIFNHKNNRKFDKIGNAKIFRILVKTYQNKIFKIDITLEKNRETSELLKLAFGKPTYNIKNNLTWKTNNNIECLFQEDLKTFDHAYITYTNQELEKLYNKEKADKKKKKAISEF